MSPIAGDNDLIRTYAREGSETAFQTLVDRHVNLVFGAAFRQVGDTGLAEEITQNVFIALARKAPRLAGHETLAGWLHRTAILEAKARIRAELRRQRRETTAANLAELENPESAAPDDLTLLLDEGLLHLRDTDRLVLVLRFLEEHSLRDVGVILGVDEDAARKRVSRALSRLTDFFNNRGYGVPAASGAALLSNAVQAAPLGLATSATQAGLAAGSALNGFNLILLQLVTLTKTQTALVCVVLLGLPLAWQWQSYRAEAQTQARLSHQFTELSQELAGANAESQRLQNSLLRARADAFNTQTRFASLQSRRGPLPTIARYHWEERSTLARVPKELLRRLSVEGVTNKQGKLSPQIRAALQLTDQEAETLQTSIDRLLADYSAIQANALRPVTPAPEDLNGHTPEQVRVFEVTGIKERVKALRQAFLQDLDSILDPERSELFARSLRNWMQDEEPSGLNSVMAIFGTDHRLLIFLEPASADEPRRLGWGIASGGGSIYGPIQVDEIPGFLQPYLQDWMEVARRAAKGESALEPVLPNQP